MNTRMVRELKACRRKHRPLSDLHKQSGCEFETYEKAEMHGKTIRSVITLDFTSE